MQRVKRSTAVAALPAPPAGGTPGYFTGGNPSGGVPATVPGYEWFNWIQEEVIAPILGAALALDENNTGQLHEALKRLTGARVTTKTATAALTLADAGLVLVDAAAGNVTLTLPAANALAAVPFRFVRIDATANVVTIAAAGTDTIEGVASVVLAINDRRLMISDGAATWRRPEAIASTTQRGMVELSTDAEADAATDSTRALTPANLAAVLGVGKNTTTAAEAISGTTLVGAMLSAAALVEYGSNANGKYWRFESGLQICTINDSASIDVTTVSGVLYYGSSTWTFPAAFSEVPAVSADYFGSAKVLASGGTSLTTTYYVSYAIAGASYAASVIDRRHLAIGRWK